MDRLLLVVWPQVRRVERVRIVPLVGHRVRWVSSIDNAKEALDANDCPLYVLCDPTATTGAAQSQSCHNLGMWKERYVHELGGTKTAVFGLNFSRLPDRTCSGRELVGYAPGKWLQAAVFVPIHSFESEPTLSD